MSWVHEEDGFQLLCNRDEKRTRAEAHGPQVVLRNGVRYIAPADADFGGTWVLVNEFGVGLSLLNGKPGDRWKAFRSRGLLLPELSGAASSALAFAMLRQMDLTVYAPFTLAALAAGAPAMVAEWDSEFLKIMTDADAAMPLISSSFEAEGVQAARRAEFDRLVRLESRLTADVLWQFHSSHGPRPSAYSPCMHRPDAQTVSSSWIRVTTQAIDFHYSPGSPCQWRASERVVLARR
ncbi:MAG: hypothetical protein ABI693_06855 [Bryobacteraceae bacterium]